MEFLAAGFVYLAAAVIAVPIANRLGLGSVLGYLIAGIVIGPILGIVGKETIQLQHFAELGVIMMLFLVGLELQPAILWRMRAQLLGLGGLQVLGTTLLFAVVALVFGFTWQQSLALGMILALSSTAIVLQTLTEKGWMSTSGGQSSFSVLLTQDIAVIPMLALMPLLSMEISPLLNWYAFAPLESSWFAAHAAAPDVTSGGPTTFEQLPNWAQALCVLAVIAAIIFVGRTLIRPMFRFIAEAKLREIFTAAALLLVTGITLLMDYVGLSPALGTFLAGVVLSDNEYRHELETDIEPFKGLLLGLFFITVGAGVDFHLLFDKPFMLVGLAAGLMALKAGFLFALGTVFNLKGADRWLFALGLAQAGEFAFVLFGLALGAGVLPEETVKLMMLVVALSMVLTPALFIIYEKILAPRSITGPDRTDDTIEEQGRTVIAGMGRFGQIVSRLLISNGHRVTMLDHDPKTIEILQRIGFRAYYGDAMRPNLLHAAGMDKAQLFIAALDDREKQNELVRHVAATYPHVTIFARAHDRHHVYELENAGAHEIERETFESSLSMGRKALISLGYHPYKAERARSTFKAHDKTSLEQLRDEWNTKGVSKSYIETVREHYSTLVDLMRSDRAEGGERSDGSWTPPPKGDSRL
ncbi:monovalent cation:proton antiporter-2 (CPA2) family protein [Flexibacterium corallicola]|uniref:monovalent cation:proton antiporter-2 (CPA2) family protein n=1 Tax=Flexibacterium corallicola TaxID=3037259 RepID=UPI00286F6D1E|nr:monovalent cation:proton antiporter-2 (CPA2) family protein [Pseudovibrio sp. M1P-2-3]